MKVKFFAAVTLLILVAVPCALSANEAHNRLMKMADSTRNAVFTTFLNKSGENCDAVVKNFFQGSDEHGNAYWNVECRNKASFVITVNNDAAGSTSILSCAMLKLVNAGKCFKKFK